MKRLIRSMALAVTLIAASPLGAAESLVVEFEAQVEAAERAFAKTMADRDHGAFATFLSEEAVFLGRTDLRGKKQVADAWKAYFEGADAPFSWEPEKVQVLESGTLALSTGPVHDQAGERTGTFTSIWRQEETGVWRIIFDRGNKYCE